MVLLWLEKVKWNDFFCKKGISYTNCPWKSKKLHIKPAKTLQKRCFDRNLHLNSANGPGPFAEFCKRSGTICGILQMVPDRLHHKTRQHIISIYVGCRISLWDPVTHHFIFHSGLLCWLHDSGLSANGPGLFAEFRKWSGTVCRIPQTVPGPFAEFCRRSRTVCGKAWIMQST